MHKYQGNVCQALSNVKRSVVVPSNHSSVNKTDTHTVGPVCNMTSGGVYFFQHDFPSFPVAPCPSYVMSALLTLWQISKRQWGWWSRG